VRPFKVVLPGREAKASHYVFIYIPPDVVRPFRVVPCCLDSSVAPLLGLPQNDNLFYNTSGLLKMILA
jgi:hypothetical protein